MHAIRESKVVKKQNEYIKDLKRKKSNFALVHTEAFVRGMRDSGYKSPLTALADLIDKMSRVKAGEGLWINSRCIKRIAHFVEFPPLSLSFSLSLSLLKFLLMLSLCHLLF